MSGQQCVELLEDQGCLHAVMVTWRDIERELVNLQGLELLQELRLTDCNLGVLKSLEAFLQFDRLVIEQATLSERILVDAADLEPVEECVYLREGREAVKILRVYGDGKLELSKRVLCLDNNMASLSVLVVTQCHLEAVVFPYALGSLTPSTLFNLKSLDLSSNELQDLPAEFFRHLVALEHLDLSDNRLRSLSPAICRLVRLSELNLSNNSLESLPNAIMRLEKLESISLTGNPLQTPPLSVASKWRCSDDIKSYFAENNRRMVMMDAGPSVPIFVLGPVHSGKSDIANIVKSFVESKKLPALVWDFLSITDLDSIRSLLLPDAVYLLTVDLGSEECSGESSFRESIMAAERLLVEVMSFFENSEVKPTINIVGTFTKMHIMKRYMSQEEDYIRDRLGTIRCIVNIGKGPDEILSLQSPQLMSTTSLAVFQRSYSGTVKNSPLGRSASSDIPSPGSLSFQRKSVSTSFSTPPYTPSASATPTATTTTAAAAAAAAGLCDSPETQDLSSEYVQSGIQGKKDLCNLVESSFNLYFEKMSNMKVDSEIVSAIFQENYDELPSFRRRLIMYYDEIDQYVGSEAVLKELIALGMVMVFPPRNFQGSNSSNQAIVVLNLKWFNSFVVSLASADRKHEIGSSSFSNGNSHQSTVNDTFVFCWEDLFYKFSHLESSDSIKKDIEIFQYLLKDIGVIFEIQNDKSNSLFLVPALIQTKGRISTNFRRSCIAVDRRISIPKSIKNIFFPTYCCKVLSENSNYEGKYWRHSVQKIQGTATINIELVHVRNESHDCFLSINVIDHICSCSNSVSIVERYSKLALEVIKILSPKGPEPVLRMTCPACLLQNQFIRRENMSVFDITGFCGREFVGSECSHRIPKSLFIIDDSVNLCRSRTPRASGNLNLNFDQNFAMDAFLQGIIDSGTNRGIAANFSVSGNRNTPENLSKIRSMLRKLYVKPDERPRKDDPTEVVAAALEVKFNENFVRYGLLTYIKKDISRRVFYDSAFTRPCKYFNAIPHGEFYLALFHIDDFDLGALAGRSVLDTSRPLGPEHQLFRESTIRLFPNACHFIANDAGTSNSCSTAGFESTNESFEVLARINQCPNIYMFTTEIKDIQVGTKVFNQSRDCVGIIIRVAKLTSSNLSVCSVCGIRDVETLLQTMK